MAVSGDDSAVVLAVAGVCEPEIPETGRFGVGEEVSVGDESARAVDREKSFKA